LVNLKTNPIPTVEENSATVHETANSIEQAVKLGPAFDGDPNNPSQVVPVFAQLYLDNVLKPSFFQLSQILALYSTSGSLASTFVRAFWRRSFSFRLEAGDSRPIMKVRWWEDFVKL
jgi:hypothetical protein